VSIQKEYIVTSFFSKNISVTAVAVLIALAIALAACGGRGDDVLRDTAWELVSLAGSDLIPGTTITLKFATATDSEPVVSGSAGCNTYGGSYKASEESLTLSGVYATERACMEPEGVMAQEQAYLAALNAAARYRVAQVQGGGERLEVYDQAGTRILVLVADGGS
jgi:heat shock protein HslJ